MVRTAENTTHSKPDTRYLIEFQPSGKTSHLRQGSLLQIANAAEVPIDAPCGGRETCGKCRIIVRLGADCLSKLKDSEMRFLSDTEIQAGYRLSCCASATSSGRVVLEVPSESQLGLQRLIVGGLEPGVIVSPSVHKFCMKVPIPSLEDLRADTERILETAKEQLSIRLDSIVFSALKALPLALRKDIWKVTVVENNGEVIAVEPGDSTSRFYGLAVDIGTTKLAAYLVDLNTGRSIATSSRVNPQTKHGSDVITRICYAMQEPSQLHELHRILIVAINAMSSEICRKTGLSVDDIYDVVVVGNTAMHHLFFDIQPESIGLSPYTAVAGGPLNVRSNDLGLHVNAGSYVHSPPNIAGFVGADTVADILATNIHQAEELTLLIDIGTNVEIVMGNRTGLQACSTPAGPALEGAEITFGMRAVEGAIESIWIDPKDMSVGYRTIGKDSLPKGICGSGIIDGISEMLKAGIIQASGEFKTDPAIPKLRSRSGITEFIIVERKLSAIDRDIAITQRDIRQIQLAKAAVYTAVLLSTRRLGVKPIDIKKVYVAGAFGTYINSQSARNIGMYPDIPLDRFRYVGNAAGARALLKSSTLRATARTIAQTIKYFPLGNEPDFQIQFLDALYIPHKDLELFPSVKRVLKLG
jgi:uncharacterized 2Fe-2S/4Fe-4S cluster protein (DUF4445 family)